MSVIHVVKILYGDHSIFIGVANDSEVPKMYREGARWDGFPPHTSILRYHGVDTSRHFPLKITIRRRFALMHYKPLDISNMTAAYAASIPFVHSCLTICPVLAWVWCKNVRNIPHHGGPWRGGDVVVGGGVTGGTRLTVGF